MMMFMGMLFMMVSHPFMLVLLLIIFVVYYSYVLYLYMGTVWYSMVLILVILSGVLVVFTYMVSFVSNESFEVSLFWLGMFFFILNIKNNFMLNMSLDMSVMSMKLWDSGVVWVNLFVVIMLLVTMLFVINISGKVDGAIWSG